MSTSSSDFQEQRTVVLFADVCDSTRLYERLGDAAALEALNNCLRRLTQVAEEYRGRIVKVLGDGLMVVFPDPASGILAACEMQTTVAAMPSVGQPRLTLRVGCNSGLILAQGRDHDVHGDTVNVAARMMEFARPGQIIATESTIAELPPLQRPSLRRLENVYVKGKAKAIPAVEILWEDAADSTLVSTRSFAAGSVFARLRLAYGDRVLMVEEGMGIVTIGRDPYSTLPVTAPAASRQHARIECRTDHFVYIDQSTNGSFVTVSGEPELRLMHEEWILRGAGWISLGQPYLKAPGLAIAYECRQET